MMIHKGNEHPEEFTPLTYEEIRALDRRDKRRYPWVWMSSQDPFDPQAVAELRALVRGLRKIANGAARPKANAHEERVH